MVSFDKFVDFFTISAKGIAKRRMRSWLTMVGIFIGIAAVVALVSLGQGLENAINEQFNELGMDKIFVMPAGSTFGAGGIDALSDHDIKVLQRVQGVDAVIGYFFSTAQVEWKDEAWWEMIMGIPTDREYAKLLQSFWKPDQGRWFRPGEKNVAIVGYDYANSPAFKQKLKVGDDFTINGQSFKVVGTFAKVGNSGDDRTVLLPMDTAREVLGVPTRLDNIVVKVKEGQDPDTVAASIEKAMRKDRGQKEGEEDFSVQTFMEFMQSFLSILNIVTTVLVGIAGISLLIGAIGIMNTMYTAVLERTKEIGVMKAIGATNGDVLWLFLIESGLLGLAGGVVGIAIGGGLAWIASYLAQNVGGFAYLTAEFPWWLIVGALAFSFLVGVLSGVLPAMQAARKNPVDSLRYE